MARRIAARSRAKRRYKMRFAGQLIKHLGLQMYGGAVPAIAELVSNAWDAMARNVWIKLPFDRPIREDDEIIVRDDGHGMTYKECNGSYLVVGYNRRSKSDWSKPYKGLKARRLQGRKGIGKLAGFGIANRIEIRTTSRDEVSHFAMCYDQLTRSGELVDAKGYEPEPLDDDGKRTKASQQTVVKLSQLNVRRSIPSEQFRRSMARRFAVMSDDFVVHINGKRITKTEMDFQFRFPEATGQWETCKLPDGQQIEWWAGFCKKPISDEEARGFVVYARGKLAQTPWFFDLSGGVWGQHGMQYLTGEVKAEFLDGSEDLIATDRGSIRWEHPLAAPLKEWGQKMVRSLLDQWVEKRRVAKVRSPKVSEYLAFAKKLPARERRVFQSVVDRICAIPHLDEDKEGKDIVEDLVEFAYNALTNRSFLDAIRRLNAASTADIAQFSEILSEWDIIEAVNTAHLVKGRVEIIHKFAQMIKDKVPEKPDMQDYLKKYPWLIDPKWTMLVHEHSLDRLIYDRFNIQSSGEKEGAQRLDFFCLGDRYQTAHVVETKRPGDLVGRKECDKLRDYVLYLRKKLIDESTDSAHRRTLVRGLLIADRIRSGDEQHARSHQDAGTFDMRTWDNLLATTETMHKEFLAVVKLRAPADDPRMKSLSDNDILSGQTPAVGGRKRKRKPRKAK